MTNSRITLVISTIDSPDIARELASSMVNDYLVACVSIEGPTTSVYRWEGEVVEEEEWTLVMKTTGERTEDVIARLEDQHPYDCPEILAFNVDESSEPYEQWVREEVR